MPSRRYQPIMPLPDVLFAISSTTGGSSPVGMAAARVRADRGACPPPRAIFPGWRC